MRGLGLLLLGLAATGGGSGCLVNQSLYDELRPTLPPECGSEDAEENPDEECVEPEEEGQTA